MIISTSDILKLLCTAPKTKSSLSKAFLGKAIVPSLRISTSAPLKILIGYFYANYQFPYSAVQSFYIQTISDFKKRTSMIAYSNKIVT